MYQLASDIDGYELIYSCYDPVKHPQTSGSSQQAFHVYFIYRPKTYTLTFMYEDGPITDTYYYNQSLEHALENHDDHDHSDPVKTGHEFKGWYPNEAGEGEKYDFNASPAPTMPNHTVVLYPRMDVIEYVVKIDPNGGVIDHINYSEPDDDYYHNCANDFGLEGTGYNESQATYFNAKYGTPIGEYTVERKYIMLTDEELLNGNYNETDKYYYLNAQFNENYDGDWGLQPNLRNAVYLTEEQLSKYYQYYCKVVDDNLGYYTRVTKLSWDEFCAAYTSYPDHPYRTVSSENYAFMGWYQVFDDGSVDTMPYNFNNPTMGPITLRALWRLEGGYYICYNPVFVSDDRQTIINGEMATWMDPESIGSQKYSDQALTRVLRAPTNESLQGWIFRGWMVVEKKTEIISGTEYFVGEPIQLDANNSPVYYQPGEVFTIDSALAKDEDLTAKIIYLQAVYEPTTGSYRRPDVTNLIIDANADSNGYIKPGSIGSIPTLSGPGNQIVNPSVLFEEKPVQVLLGDFQSNIALHLFGYASVMEHKDGYLLLGFDENSDPTSPSTGYAYIPKFAADSVIAVTKNETGKTIYAMWEPMVYATFVNTTDEDIEINISGTGASTVSIVNKVTGAFSRESSSTTFIIPAKSGGVDGSIKVVFPAATAGVDSITVTATNTHLRRLMSVAGQYPNSVVYGIGSTDIRCGNLVSYDGTLVTDKDGIIVTYTETVEPQVLYDVNGGTWNPLSEDPPYQHSAGDLYFIEAQDIITYNNGNYEPAEPSRTGKVFIGWTEYDYIAAHTDFSSMTVVTWDGHTITPDTDGIVLDKIRSDYLWDFSQDAELLYNNEKTLYAVWSDAVTVTFDIARDNSHLHLWGVDTNTTETPGDYVFYRNPSSNMTVTYKMAKGERVPKPSDPSPSTDKPTWHFVTWLLNNMDFRNTTKSPSDIVNRSDVYKFSQRVYSNILLSTSWTTNPPQTFSFTVKNVVENGIADDEFTYTIAVSDAKILGKKNGKNQVVDPSVDWGTITVNLKNNEEFTVIITVSAIKNWDGNSVCIEAIDNDGVVIKSEYITKFDGQNKPNFTSDYRYTLSIVQAEKTGYTTTLEKQVLSGSITFSPDDSNLEFMFNSRESRTSNTSEFTNIESTFRPEINNYADGNTILGGDNALSLVFTNTRQAVVAPTDYRDSKSPFLWLFAAGLVLFAVAIIYDRRKDSVLE